MTTSEEIFEHFLNENNISFKKIPIADTPRPDYLVIIDSLKFVFEVTELGEDSNFDIKMGTSSRIIGDHIRQKINDKKKQVQWAKKEGIPAILLIYNNIDPLQLFGTEQHDFITAMHGEHTVLISKKTMKAVDSYYGRNDALQVSKNTSFSALGHLWQYSKRGITLYENSYAALNILYETLPPCFDIVRFEITNSSATKEEHTATMF